MLKDSMPKESSMSCERVRNKSLEESVLDKEIEQRFAVIGNRFSELLEIRKEIQELKDALELEKKQHQATQAKLAQVNTELSRQIIDLSNRSIRVNADIGQIEVQQQELKKECATQKEVKDRFFESLNKSYTRFDDIEKSIKNIPQPKDFSADIEHFQTETYKLKELVRNLADKCEKTSDFSIASCKNMAKESSYALTEIEQFGTFVNGMKLASNELNAKMEKRYEQMKATIDKLQSIIEIAQKASNLPQDIVTRADLATHTAQNELIALDAKNASLKASNGAMQIELLNKKVENIQLLLKRHELNG